MPKHKQKLTLHLAGSENGLPTLDDLVAMAKALTGRDPTPEEIEVSRALLEARALLDKAGGA
jgi:hypothetical protein